LLFNNVPGKMYGPLEKGRFISSNLLSIRSMPARRYDFQTSSVQYKRESVFKLKSESKGVFCTA